MAADIFFDVDGCLVDTQYNANLNEGVMKSAVEELIEDGSVFHLNSNRSIESLSGIYERFGFNGVMITENGTSVYDMRDDSVKSFGFDKIDRGRLERNLASNGESVMFVESDKLIRNPGDFSDFVDEGVAYFCEKTRKYTMTIYPREKVDGVVCCTPETLNQTYKKLLAAYGDYVLEANPNYDNIIMVPRGVEKGTVLPSVSRSGKIISFGDGVADISMFRMSSFFGAPKNACDDVKTEVLKKGGYLSDLEFTAGAHDFINKIKEIENER